MDVNRLHKRRHTLLVRTNLVGRPIFLPSVLLLHHIIGRRAQGAFCQCKTRGRSIPDGPMVVQVCYVPGSRLLRDGVTSQVTSSAWLSGMKESEKLFFNKSEKPNTRVNQRKQRDWGKLSNIYVLSFCQEARHFCTRLRHRITKQRWTNPNLEFRKDDAWPGM
jgi:hypothetical protein